MDKIYETTKAGRKAYKRSALGSEEMKVMEYLMSSKAASTSQLDTVCEGWLLRSMKRRGLIREVGRE
jgi:enterochelin esterase-like enzyme